MLSRQWPQPTEALPIRHELDTVPFYPQKDYQCGPASLAMALTWSGIQVDPEKITPEVFTPSLKGSLQSSIITTVRRRGRVAYPISGAETMLEEVAAGHPVIILQNLGLSWYPVWHYAVVVGYDLELGIVLLHSGVTSRKCLSQRVFNNTWARSDYWGLLVLPPSRLPATATEHNYLSAVLGLEKAKQWQAAIEGYNSALDRWPDSLSARMGLGNSYYALGDLESAEAAFREATLRFPTNGMAYNNLAQVLWERGNREEALEAARKAVDLDGPLAEEYRRTLKEIQAGKP
jgi:hypothetical protein